MAQECKDADIEITPAAGRVIVRFNGRPIADTSKALALREGDYPIRIYVPRSDVDATVLQDSAHTTYCPYKGDASYHHLKANDAVSENAVWYYTEPCPLVEQVRDHLAFWGNDIEVTIES